MLNLHRTTFKTDKPIIGCLHMMALPGTPYYDPSVTIEAHIERLKQDARILMELGYDAVVFANEGDRPYLGTVGPEIITTYVRIATEVLPEIKVPYGCGVLIDPIATLAVAKAIGAKFIRTYVSNSYVGSFGKQDFSPAEIFRYQRMIDAMNVRVYTYFEAHAGVCLDTRPTEDQIASGLANFPIAGTIVGGPRAGLPPELATFAHIKAKFPEVPLLLGSGANVNNIKEILKHADGVIVGTTIKKDAYLFNPIDYDRAKAFIQAAKG